MFARHRRFFIGLAIAWTCVSLVLPVPHYLLGYRPAWEHNLRFSGESSQLIQECVAARQVRYATSAGRKAAMVEGREDFVREQVRIEEEAIQRENVCLQRLHDYYDNNFLLEREEFSNALSLAKILALASDIGTTHGLTAAIVIWRRSGRRAAMLFGAVVGLVATNVLANVWWRLLVGNALVDKNEILRITLCGFIGGLLIGLLCGVTMRSTRSSTTHTVPSEDLA